MRKLIFIAHSCLLIFTFLGCVTTDPDVGKRVPSNYYVLNCESFPAEGFVKNKDVEIDFQISKIENNKFLITGIMKTVFGGAFTNVNAQELSLSFLLLKGNLIVDSVIAPISGNPQLPMKIKKSFISEVDFDGITVGRFIGRAWEYG